MERITKIISIIIFFVLIFSLCILTIVLPKSEKSEMENRTLEKLPEISFDTYLDKTLMKGLDTYVSDHFVMRSNWMTAKTTIEKFLGKYEFEGVYVLDDKMVEKLEEPDQEIIDRNIAGINNFAQATGLPCYVMLVPTAGEIYREELPKYAPQFDQKEFINDVYYQLDDSITRLDVFSTLYSTRDEYIYYRTDHHWTSLGAYYAYYSTMNQMGITPLSIDKFDIEHASSSFQGTLYSQAIVNTIKPDTIDYYTSREGGNIVEYRVPGANGESVYDSIYMRDYLNVKDKYSSFTGANAALNTIITDVENGEKILVIKDSYANCYMQFLSKHFSEISMVDLRYAPPIPFQFFIKDLDSYDKVLFLYNASSFTTDDNLKVLSLIK